MIVKKVLTKNCDCHRCVLLKQGRTLVCELCGVPLADGEYWFVDCWSADHRNPHRARAESYVYGCHGCLEAYAALGLLA